MILQDASRLLDLGRQCIIFEGPSDLAAGLATIRRDPDVAVARVKNRMHINADATPTAGSVCVEYSGGRVRLSFHLLSLCGCADD